MGRGVSAAGISFADDKLHVGGGNGPAAEAAGKSAGRKEPGTGEKKALPPDDRRRSQCGEIFSDQSSDWQKKHPDWRPAGSDKGKAVAQPSRQHAAFGYPGDPVA